MQVQCLHWVKLFISHTHGPTFLISCFCYVQRVQVTKPAEWQVIAKTSIMMCESNSTRFATIGDIIVRELLVAIASFKNSCITSYCYWHLALTIYLETVTACKMCVPCVQCKVSSKYLNCKVNSMKRLKTQLDSWPQADATHATPQSHREGLNMPSLSHTSSITSAILTKGAFLDTM